MHCRINSLSTDRTVTFTSSTRRLGSWGAAPGGIHVPCMPRKISEKVDAALCPVAREKSWNRCPASFSCSAPKGPARLD
eukprot:6254081-Pyramimonas_sp.AAC.1